LHVAKHHCHDAPLALSRRQFRLIDQPFHHARIDVPAECFADALLVAQLLDHAIERSRELANFVVRDDFDRPLKVTRFNLAGAFQDHPDRRVMPPLTRIAKTHPSAAARAVTTIVIRIAWFWLRKTTDALTPT